MAQAPITAAQLQAAAEAMRSGRYRNISEAARALGKPDATFRGWVRRARELGILQDAPVSTVEILNRAPLVDPPDVSRGLPFEREWSKWMDAVGMVRDRYAGPARAKARNGRLKVIGAGDFHVPFHHREALARMIQQDGDADVLVIGGDFIDAHAASTFTKYEHVGFHEEMAAATLVMQSLSESFPIVKYLRGSNHPDRFEKRLREHLTKDLLDAILSMTGGILAPDIALVKRYPNVEVCHLTTPSGPCSWLMNVGDVLFSHAEKYSRVPGSALRTVEEWLSDFKGHLGIDEYRAVVQFHTHAAAMLPWRSDKLLIEPGCMCSVHHYQLGSRIAGRPQRLGYVVMEIVDGRVDFNSVRMRMLDAEFQSAA
jgi:hypothetical protein